MYDFSPKTTHVLDLISYFSQILSSRGIESARLNAERLLAQTLGTNRATLYLEPERSLSPNQLKQFTDVIYRRLKNEPLQYILETTEFMSLPIRVNRSVLIPRPETEILVESVIDMCRQMVSKKEIRILDIGTGSGCIAVSLARYLEKALIDAVDIAAETLATAKENASLNHVSERINFAKTDFFGNDFAEMFEQKFDIVVSNPPYISKADFASLPQEIRGFEPDIALHDNSDGLTFYHRLAELMPLLLKPTGILAVEVGMGQAQLVCDLFAARDKVQLYTIQDLTGIDRVVICSKRKIKNLQARRI